MMTRKRKIEIAKGVLSVIGVAGGYVALTGIIDDHLPADNIVAKGLTGVFKLLAGCALGDIIVKTSNETVDNVAMVYDEVEAKAKVE